MLTEDRSKATIRRNGVDLPKYCECGGNMEYVFLMDRIFSCCDRCSPKVQLKSTK